RNRRRRERREIQQRPRGGAAYDVLIVPSTETPRRDDDVRIANRGRSCHRRVVGPRDDSPNRSEPSDSERVDANGSDRAPIRAGKSFRPGLCAVRRPCAAGRLVSTLLFGVAPTDPATIALAVVLMEIVSAFAAFVPARTASRVDPMIALRYE